MSPWKDVPADLSFLWFTAGIGVFAALGLLFCRWPGWVGFPLSILAIRFGVDAGIAPLTRYKFGLGELLVEDVTIIGPAPTDEIAGAVMLLALGYGSIAAGMLAIRAFATRALPARTALPHLSAEAAQRGYRASTWIYLFGVAVNLTAIYIAGTGLEVEDIAATRAAFTNEAAYGNAWFNYAWTLKTTMQIGALGMLIFAYRLRRHIATAWAANLLYFLVQPVFGGRTAVIVGGLALALVYHHGVRKMRAGSLLVIALVVLGGLAYIATVRHKAESLSQAIAMSVMQVGSSRAMEEVAFARREFPDRVPYFDGSTIIAGLSMALPGLDVGKNLWLSLEDEFLGRGYRTAEGIGGQTISTTGESYMNFGIAGVIGIGLLAGGLFGVVYEWQRRNPGNPFAVLLAAMVTVVFVVAIYKKLPTRISDIPLRILLPLGFVAAYATGGRVYRGYAMLVGTVLAGLAVFRLTTSPMVKYATLLPIVAMLLYSVHAQVTFGRVDALRRRLGHRAAGRFVDMMASPRVGNVKDASATGEGDSRPSQPYGGRASP